MAGFLAIMFKGDQRLKPAYETMPFFVAACQFLAYTRHQEFCFYGCH